MERLKKTRKIYVGAAFVAVLLGLGVGQAVMDNVSAQARQAPKFEVDPFWPKAMPNNWVMGMTIGIGISADDHVWVIHRGNDARNLDQTELAIVKEGAPRVGGRRVKENDVDFPGEADMGETVVEEVNIHRRLVCDYRPSTAFAMMLR